MARTLLSADRHNILFLASAIAFDSLMAAVPFLLLLLIGLTHLAELSAHASDVDLNHVFERFLPAHTLVGGKDPFAPVEALLTSIAKNRARLSFYATAVFLWFSTRLFASLRTSLNQIFECGGRPSHRHFIIHFLRSKLRDIGMVFITILLFGANTFLSAGLGVLKARAASVATMPGLHFFVTSIGRFLTELLAFSFVLSLFLLVYKYASRRRLPWRSALVAATFTALAFEVAKRLYGLYLQYLASMQAYSGNATLGAFILFVVWLYYMAVVFLFGGAIADVKEKGSCPTPT